MSEINAQGAKVLAPPVFPVGGRLPGDSQAVLKNYYQQTREEDRYKQSRDEQGRRRWSACCHTLYISLVFDVNKPLAVDERALHAVLFHARPECR